LKKLLLRLNGLQCLKLMFLPSVHEFFADFASGYITMPESGICGVTCQY
jgi:hypothetical protein